MSPQSIIEMKAKKHVKIFLLSQLGIKKSEIGKLLGTGPGHVYNVLKEYKEKPNRAQAANSLIVLD